MIVEVKNYPRGGLNGNFEDLSPRKQRQASYLAHLTPVPNALSSQL